MRFHCQGTRPAPLSTRQEPDDRACEVTIQHSTLGHDVDERQRADVVTELHLLTGAGTTAATATADAVVVGVMPARSDEDTEKAAPRLAPGAAAVDAAFDGELAALLAVAGATGKADEVVKIPTPRRDHRAAARRRRARPARATTARRPPSRCAGPPGRRPARWPARTTR